MYHGGVNPEHTSHQSNGANHIKHSPCTHLQHSMQNVIWQSFAIHGGKQTTPLDLVEKPSTFKQRVLTCASHVRACAHRISDASRTSFVKVRTSSDTADDRSFTALEAITESKISHGSRSQ